MAYINITERTEIDEDKPHTRQEQFLFRMIFLLGSLLFTTQMDSCLSRLCAKFAAMPEIQHTLYVITSTIIGYLAIRLTVRTITRALPSIIFSEQTGFCRTKNMVILTTAIMALSISVCAMTFCVLKII